MLRDIAGPQTRIWWIAAAVSIVTTLLAMLFRPLWLDEYWTLYISGYDTSWAETFGVRMQNDIHPPLAYYPLHLWMALFQSDLAARMLNWVYLALGFALAAWIGRDRRQETALYLFLAVTTFWFTFYGVEIRNYALLYALSVASVPAMRRAIEGDKLGLGWLALWTALSMAISFTHYYGTLWVGSTGLVAGVTMLAARRPVDFVIIGVASVIAVAPTIAFALAVDFSARAESGHITGYDISWAERMRSASMQVVRAIAGKIFLGNIPAWIAVFMASPLIFARKERNDWALVIAPLLVVAISLGVMAVMLSDMRERSFTPIIPPLLYVCARGLAAATEKGGRAAWFGRLAPWAAMLAPVLFIPEHFKDRQRYPEVRAYLEETRSCSGQPVLAAMIWIPQAENFPPWYVRHALKPMAGGPPDLIDAPKAAAQDIGRVAASACPVKAVALGMARGDGEEHQRARDQLRAAGLPLDQLIEINLGKGQNRLFVEPGYATATHDN
jgi:hypothetical protein